MTTRLASALGIEHPILLGPFGGLSSVELAATVSRSGGLGGYGLYGYRADRIHDTIAALKAATDRPFAVNLWVPTGDEVTPEQADLASSTAALAPLFDELGVAIPPLPAAFLPDFAEQVDAVLAGRPAAISFVYGVPPADVVTRAQAAGIRVIGTATTVDEAVVLASGGVDAVVASGAEAAGHRVSFLHRAEDALVGTFALIPQVADAVSIPVVAAGGIADRRGVAAAFALGADGVQVGTAFLRTRQSAAAQGYRAALTRAAAHDTVLTRAMSGRLSRGIRNRAVRTIEASGAIAPFPAQNWLTAAFRTEAARRNLPDLLSSGPGRGHRWPGSTTPRRCSPNCCTVFRADTETRNCRAHADPPPGTRSGRQSVRERVSTRAPKSDRSSATPVPSRVGWTRFVRRTPTVSPGGSITSETPVKPV
jgi:nitronate monooxygenase